MAREKELTTDDKFELLIQALTAKQGEGITRDTLQEILTANATAVQKAMKPENDAHPNKSVFRPNGGPDPELPFEFYYLNFPVHKFRETHHDKELELAAQVKPGTYPVLRRDMQTVMPFEVKGERDGNGTLTKITVEASISREEKHLVPPMQVVLYQIVHANGNPKQLYMQAMQEYMQTLMGNPVSV
jgi:hypothetical protein